MYRSCFRRHSLHKLLLVEILHIRLCCILFVLYITFAILFNKRIKQWPLQYSCMLLFVADENTVQRSIRYHIRSVLVNRRKKWKVWRRLVLKAQRKFVAVKSLLSAQKIKKVTSVCPPDWRHDGVHLFVNKAIHILSGCVPPSLIIVMYVFEFFVASLPDAYAKIYSTVVYLNSFQFKSVSFSHDLKNCSNVDQTGDMTTTGSLKCSHNN